jgi:hypothetical protein
MVSPVIDDSVSFFCPICPETYVEAGMVQPSKYTEIFGVAILIVRRFIGAMIKYPRSSTAWVTSMFLSINAPSLLCP